MRLVDLTGKRFGRLIVLKRHSENTKRNKPMWVCLCDCGNQTIVDGSSLSTGNTKSCGCLNRDSARQRMSTHGLSKTKLYGIWCGMKHRCYNPNDSHFKYYGGHNIKVCPEWKDDFETFQKWAINNDYTEGSSIERIDVDGDYCPENCCWITLPEQAKNKRTTIHIMIDGITKPLCDWAKEYGVKYATALYRYHKGYSVDKIFYKGDF